MSSLKGKYSPPYTVNLFGEVDLSFKRMLTQEWEELSEQIKNARIESENAKINTELKGSPVDRAEARTRMRAFMESALTLSSVMRESANTAKGMRRLLAYSLIEKDKAEWLELLSPIDIGDIVDQIVYLPVVKQADPQKLPPQDAALSGGSDNQSPSPTGQDLQPTSSTSSQEQTPEN